MIKNIKNKIYSLSKSRRILKSAVGFYNKKGKTLHESELKQFESELEKLDVACLEKNREQASIHAKNVETFSEAHFSKSIFDYIKELGIALIIALALATIIRQTWFELYEIPTGSMRPTFQEKDDLTVTKTAFGINIPLMPGHFYFNPDLVQRTSVVILSGDGIDLPDVDTTYFGIFPYKKRYIKRLIGKPGDSLYFYGGKIYGVDSKGNPIDELLTNPRLSKLDYIPFLGFDGKLASVKQNEILFKHMNIPVGKLEIVGFGKLKGQVLSNNDWVDENPKSASQNHRSIETFSDFFGIRNFAKARLLTKEELLRRPDINKENLEEGILYLELAHTPSLTWPKPQINKKSIDYNLLITPQKTIIPLQQKHLDRILENMYTARFEVKNGYARRYSVTPLPFNAYSPKFPGVDDGTYEFYYGKAKKIEFAGISFDVDENSPLYSKGKENIRRLFNLGMEVNLSYDPSKGFNRLFPNRYAYFRDGDLYLMGAKIIDKDDQTLIKFNQREMEKQKNSSLSKPYIAFQDHGPPTTMDNKLDVEFIRTFGVTVPDKHYLVLGDNHANSGDSRVFGFVPENNLRGAPSLIIWPPGDRLGVPNQKPYPIFTLSRVIVWLVFGLVLITIYFIHRQRINRRYFKKKKFK